MKRITRLVFLAAFACAVALPAAALAGDEVPLRGSDQGSWGLGTHNCGALLPVFVADSGAATHLGRYAYSSQECANLAAGTYAGSFTMTAASGDTVTGTYAGTFTVDAAGTIHYEQTNTITGGTGRFASASGTFALSGLAFANGDCAQELSGAISRVGG